MAMSLVPGRAEAAGIPLVYNSGDHLFATGPLPSPLDKDPDLAGFEAGYLCQVKGVAWSYFSVSDCRPVAFKGDAYVEGPEVVKALSAKYTESDIQRGAWGRFGWMGFGIVLAIGAVLWLKEKLSDSSDEVDEAA